MQIIIEIPESKIPKQQDVIEIPLHFMDGKVCEAGGYSFDVLPKGDEDIIERLDGWLEDEDRNPDTMCIDGQYNVSSTDIDDFCDFLTENEPDLIGISCNVCGEGIWFSKNDLINARRK